MKRNKILLINTVPASLEGIKRPNNFPHGLLAIGTWISKKSNFEVKLIDCLFYEQDYKERIKKEIQKGDVLMAGLSVMSSCTPNALELTRLIKKLDPEIKTMWGGVHCLLYPEQTAKHNSIDFVAYAEGEKPMLNLANCLSKKKSFSKVKGIIYKKDGKTVRTLPEEFMDLNELGMLNYDLLDKDVFKPKRTNIMTSRGCPYRCTFCINVVTKNRKWRWMTADNVIKQIKYLIKNHNIKVLSLADECFFINKQRSEEVLDLLIKNNIKLRITGNARANFFTNGLITQETIKKMKKVGFYNVSFGIEFGSDKMRNFIKKDISEEDVIAAVTMLKKEGIGGTYSFMTAFPTETKKDTMATVKLIKKMYAINKGMIVLKGDDGSIYEWREKVRIAGPQVYRPYPGGELYDYVTSHYDWQVPKTLEGWEKYFKDNTRYQLEDYPWIKKPNFYAALQFYVKNGKTDFSTFLKRVSLPYSLKDKFLMVAFYPFAKFRMAFNFFEFPIEYIVGKKLGILDKMET
jgi:anaerobic magnesium-protoporphyrin IX monomethyl ester cyclase